MYTSSLFKSSLGKKIIMAITGFFLMIFLIIHLIINSFIFLGEKRFNKIAFFMENNFIIQFLQYILALGFILHIFFGIKLYIENKRARGNINYAMNKWKMNTSINAQSMIYTGILILLFIIIHLKNFLLPIKLNINNEINNYKLISIFFKNPIYTILYIISFIILAFHLSHGVNSSFQSIGIRHNKYYFIIKKINFIYYFSISLGFSIIAIYLFLK